MSEPIPEKRPDKNARINVIKFALLVSFVCSLLITAAAGGLKGFQQENIELDKKINLLKAANLIDPDNKPSKNQIKALYDTHIQAVIVDSQGTVLEAGNPDSLQLYFFKTKDVIQGYILPITSRGLWGKIQGYLAFENDGQTVSGFSVYSHSETPGLGGEIESAWFQKNFKGKKILNSQNQFVSVGIAKGKAADLPKSEQANHVDGISGATLTGKYLSQGIKSTLAQYEAVSITFRQKGLSPKEKN
ncbi:MAG: FMN-binding protein [Proteobacteria bacterium]|nr:FMN-binding protein [Desulfobacula sp.]MBU3954083.1 FMN-binding protein [Pseudomonadota bacterium]MBU4133088.1 FMN-binding protein [Pseudomonadota bacterium]